MIEHEAVDALKKRWTGNTIDLIAEFLISFYATPANAEKTYPLLSEDLVCMGSAFVAHKKIGQVF